MMSSRSISFSCATWSRRPTRRSRPSSSRPPHPPSSCPSRPSYCPLGPPLCQRRLSALSSTARRGTSATLQPGGDARRKCCLRLNASRPTKRPSTAKQGRLGRPPTAIGTARSPRQVGCPQTSHLSGHADTLGIISMARARAEATSAVVLRRWLYLRGTLRRPYLEVLRHIDLMSAVPVRPCWDKVGRALALHGSDRQGHGRVASSST